MIGQDDDDYSNIDKLIMELMAKPIFIFEAKKLPEIFNMLNAKNTYSNNCR